MAVPDSAFDEPPKFDAKPASEIAAADAAQQTKLNQSAASAIWGSFKNFVGNQIEHAKNAIAANAELTNAGARLFMASVNPTAYLYNDFPEAIKPGAAKKGVDTIVEKGGEAAAAGARLLSPLSRLDPEMQQGEATKALRANKERFQKEDEGSASKAVGAMTEGAVSSMIFPAPGMTAVKNVVMGMGMGEGSEIGKWVFGGLGSMFDTTSNIGRAIGEDVGSVIGGAAGGPLNNVRVNAMTKAGGALALGTKASVGSVFPAARGTWDALKAGDERKAGAIFMDHYSELRAKSIGLLQEQTNQKLAGILQRNPEHQQAVYDFDQAARAAEVNPDQFTLGQKTKDATLVAAERADPGYIGENVTKVNVGQAQKTAIAKAYQNIVTKALPTDPKSLAEAGDLYRAGADARVDKLEKAADGIRQSIPNWTDTQSAEAGKGMRDQYDRAHQDAKGEFNKRYEDVYADANASGVRYDLQPVVKDTKAVLTPLLAKIDGGAAPTSIRNLNNLLLRDKAQAAKVKEASENVPFYMKGKTDVVQPKGYSFREIDQVIHQLGDDAHSAFASDTLEGKTQGQALNKIAESLLDQLDKQSPPEVRQAYSQIRADYATKFVPRFKEGVNYNMDREAASSRAARERITDQNVWSQYLNKHDLVDRMEQFDNLASGKLGKPMPEAYKGLSQAVQDRYSKEVTQGGFTREKHDKFFREYNSALDRVPDARKSLEKKADGFDAVNQRKQAELEQYKEAVSGNIKQAIGPVQAQQLFLQAMADPVKMEKLLALPQDKVPAKAVLKEAMVFADPMQNGTYDPEKLQQLLNMGQKFPGQPTTMEMLFNKALGPEEGRAHAIRLQAVAELMEREKLLDSAAKPDKASEGPVKSSTGQSAASWLTGARSMSAGFGAHYFPLVSAGRFLNNSMQKAMTAAQRKALYDPEMSKAILEMAQTPSNQALSLSAWNKVFGSVDGSRGFLKQLLDRGLVKPQVARGALYGYQRNESDDDRDSAKPKRQMNLP